MIDDLRLLSLADAGQLKLERKPTDLGAPAERLVDHLHTQAETHQVSLTVEAPPDLPLVPADPDGLRQIITNLVNNALRHTPPGGHIEVESQVGQGTTFSFTLPLA